MPFILPGYAEIVRACAFLVRKVCLSVLLSGSLFFQTLFGLCAYFWAAPVELIVNSCSWAQLIEGRLALARG